MPTLHAPAPAFHNAFPFAPTYPTFTPDADGFRPYVATGFRDESMDQADAEAAHWATVEADRYADEVHDEQAVADAIARDDAERADRQTRQAARDAHDFNEGYAMGMAKVADARRCRSCNRHSAGVTLYGTHVPLCDACAAASLIAAVGVPLVRAAMLDVAA